MEKRNSTPELLQHERLGEDSFGAGEIWLTEITMEGWHKEYRARSAETHTLLRV